MIDLSFDVLDVVPDRYSATPQVTVRLRIREGTGQTVHAIALRCQVRIEPHRRGYDDQEVAGVRGLFGDRDRWSETLRPFLWMQTSTLVQGFTEQTEVDLPLPVTYDFDVTGSRYLQALEDGVVPLSLMFSGPVFTRGTTGFGVEQVPWDREARCGLPVAVWRAVMAQHFPGTGWLRLDHDLVRELDRYRAEHGLTSWDETMRHLLAGRVVDEVRP